MRKITAGVGRANVVKGMTFVKNDHHFHGGKVDIFKFGILFTVS